MQAIYHRIECPSDFDYSPPISYSFEGISKIQQFQFLCRLMSHCKPQFLSFVQTVLNDFLKSKENLPEGQGCIDETAGGAIGVESEWSLDVDGALSKVIEDPIPITLVGRIVEEARSDYSIPSWHCSVRETKACISSKSGTITVIHDML